MPYPGRQAAPGAGRVRSTPGGGTLTGPAPRRHGPRRAYPSPSYRPACTSSASWSPMTKPCAVIAGIGHALPTTIVTNDDLAARLDTTDEWIRTRRGIRRRHIGSQGRGHRGPRGRSRRPGNQVGFGRGRGPRHPGDHHAGPPVSGVRARGGEPAGSRAGSRRSTWARSAPGSSTAWRPGCRVDLGQFGAVLLIGADTFSSILDPEDRATAILFGDGAGAVVLRRGESDEPGAVLGVSIGSDEETRKPRSPSSIGSRTSPCRARRCTARPW